LITHWEKSFDFKCEVVDTVDALKTIQNSLIIFNYQVCTSSCAALIKELNAKENAVLVLHRMPNIQKARELLKSGAKGYGNAYMKTHFFNSAVDTIEEKMIWLHPEFTSLLINDIPNTNENYEDKLIGVTTREKEVAILLRDGYSYKSIAQQLEITPRTVKAHAQNLYKKLNVKDRLALAIFLK